jgi:hypothetical protein
LIIVLRVVLEVLPLWRPGCPVSLVAYRLERRCHLLGNGITSSGQGFRDALDLRIGPLIDLLVREEKIWPPFV